jgi:hypothetical protein
VLLEDLALGVVANVHDVDETAQIELLGSELGHGCVVLGILVIDDETCGSKLPESIVHAKTWSWYGGKRASCAGRRSNGGDQVARQIQHSTKESPDEVTTLLQIP